MDSYDPKFNPETYDPNNPGPPPPDSAPAYDDPDMGYIHDAPPPAPVYDNRDPNVPGVDAGVYDDAPHPGYDGEDVDGDHLYDDNAYIDEHHHDGGDYPPGDIPHNIGVGYEPDENGNYGDGFDDDDDVYLDNHRNPRISPEIESTDPKDGVADPRSYLITCTACTCLFLLIGLIILIARIREISEEDAKKQPSPNHHGQVWLVPPPAELAQKCTRKLVLSEKGFYECEQLCENADCCDFPKNLALSCLAGHDDECLEYHQHCNVLQLDEAALAARPPKPPTNVPEAPADIDNKCNIESLRTVPGFEGCVNDCMLAECCWKKDGSVHPCTSLDVCTGYASCLTMDVTDHVNVDINKEITEKCDDDKLTTEVGRNQCIFACSHAACCFDPAATCPHDDARFCTQYQPCQKIFDDQGQVIQGGSATAQQQIPQAPQFLDTACSKSSLDTLPGYEMCLGACSEAQCCWQGEAQCLKDGNHGCDGYHHCVSLLDKEHPNQQGAGSGSSAATTPAPTPDENSVPAAPQYLPAACSSASLDTSAGFQMCQDACMQAECCWKVSSCSERSECSSYSTHCANLVARLDENGNDNGGTSATGTDSNAPFLPGAPQDLEQTCDPLNVAAAEGYDKCEDACDKAVCCWKTGATDSCALNSDCEAWSPCSVMNGAQDPEAVAEQDYSIEQVFDACLNHDNNVGGGNDHQSLCQIVCQSGNCCFDSLTECPNTLDCKVFDPCEVLHTEKQSQVEAACNGDDLAECVGVCATATCCFTNDIQKICDVTNPDVICKQYKACEILYGAELSNP